MKYSLLILLIVFGLVTEAFSSAQINNGVIRGKTVDSETGEAVGFAYLYLEELNRTLTTDANGSFHFRNIPEGKYTLSASRIGYRAVSQSVSVTPGDTTHITLSMEETVLNSSVIEVVGNRQSLRGSSLDKTSKTISGETLRRNLETTLAGTLGDIPGLSSRKMGSAPARPILRGLGGERLLILQDGERTGDVSSQSTDHAVTVDPIHAEKIEIARGPDALRYGSNAIGGVINIVRNQIPATHPDRFQGTASIQGISVSEGGAAALEASLPASKNLALKFDGNVRTAGNINTPSGTLSNSSLFSTSGSVGLSYIRPWGYAGLASNVYINNYGIPPDPDGGHANGVDIEMRKITAETKTEIEINDSFFKSLDADLSYKNYYHRELESDNTIGTEFGLLTTNASFTLDHRSWELTDNGQFGLWTEIKDYAVSGTRTPSSNSRSVSSFVIEERSFGALKLQAAGRLNVVNTVPEESNPNSDIGYIRERNFSGLAWSAAAIYNFGSGFTAGASVLRSFRAPSQEELYSEGPHLASYSYEVGNPDLEPERGLGKELFIRSSKDFATAEINLYHNNFDNYIYPRNTGRKSTRFPTLDVYQFSAVEATFKGIEFASSVQLLNRWNLSGSLSYTHAQRMLTAEEQQQIGGSDTSQPLPMIPPLTLQGGLYYVYGDLQFGINTKWADQQNRTGDFETSTKGYNTWNISGQYRFQTEQMLHTFSLGLENLFDTTYREHLSRIKNLMPAPGRNISLLYRAYF